MSEPVNCLEQLYKHCEIVSPLEAVNVFRKSLARCVRNKVAMDGYHQASFFSKLIEPTSIAMNFEAGFCGDRAQSIKHIRDFFESDAFKHLHAQLDRNDSVLLTDDDLLLMDISPGPSSQPSKKRKNTETTVRSKIVFRLRNLFMFGDFQNNFRQTTRNCQICLAGSPFELV